MLALIAVFVGLLAFHFWLLSRMVARGDALLSALLVVAIVMFAWRLVHYARRLRRLDTRTVEKDRITELGQIRIMAPALVGLLALHAWLLYVTLSTPEPTSVEYAFAALLVLAVVVFITRLAYYARRYAALRRSA
jgi:ABC-type uncharacterized transport system permease subunit